MKEHKCSSAAGSIKILGQLWQEMTEEQKKPYTKLRDKDLLRFQTQTKELATKGYFTLENGEKSTEYYPKGKQQPPKTTITTSLGKRTPEERVTISIDVDDEHEDQPQKQDPMDEVMAVVEQVVAEARSRGSIKGQGPPPVSSASSVNDSPSDGNKTSKRKRQKLTN